MNTATKHTLMCVQDGGMASLDYGVELSIVLTRLRG